MLSKKDFQSLNRNPIQISNSVYTLHSICSLEVLYDLY
jgi:hypothetical protein